MNKQLRVLAVLLLSIFFVSCTPKDQRLLKEGNDFNKAKNYEGAIAKYLEVVTLNPSAYKAYYNLAVAYSKLDPPNYENSAIYIKKAIETAKESKTADAKTQKGYAKKATEIVKGYYENVVKEKDTLEDYKKFIEEYPDYPGKDDINEKIAKKKFDVYQKKDTIEGYEEYIKNNAGSKFIYNAESGIYQKLVEKDSEESYKAFLKDHPDSKFVKEINVKLTGKEYDQILKIESTEEMVKQLNDFMKKYPDSELAGQAKTKIDTISWDDAQKKGSIEAFKKFAADFKDSAHYKDALANVDKLQFSKVKSDASALSSAEEKIALLKKFLTDNPTNKYGDKVKEQIVSLEKALQKAKEEADAKKAEEAKAAEGTKPPEEVKPAEGTKPAEEAKPAAPAEAPKEGAKPAETTKPAETPKEAAKPAEGDKKKGDAKKGEEEQPGDLFIP